MSDAPRMTIPTESGAMAVYQFDAFRVRIIDRDGSPWWVLADVCEVLGLGNPSMVAERLADDEKMTLSLAEGHSGQRGGAQSMRIINESGLYAVILRSNKPDAIRFRHWITSEVLPSIRRTGSYGVPKVPSSFAEALRLAADLEEKRLALESKIAADAPKVELADAIGKSDRSMSITDAAKHFGLHPVAEVFPYLRARGYLTERNLPTQAAIDAGYLALRETKDQAGNVWPQAVVEVWQLETWREHVVKQVKRWAAETKATA